MVFLLALLSFITVAAGVFGLGLAVPVRETWFGAALLMAGSVAVTGGFILVGLAVAVHELRQIGQRFKAPSSGMPRSVRPLERRDEEPFDDVDGQTAPRTGMPAPLGSEADDTIPAHFDGADTRWRKGGPEEWLLRAMAEIEAATRHTEAAPAPIDYQPGDIRRRSSSWPRPTITLPPDPPPYPPPLAGESRVRGTSSVSSRDIFTKETLETIWSSERRSSGALPEQRRETRTRSAESRSPPLSPAQAAASASSKPMSVEQPPLPVLKSGVIQETAYTLFTDGSIETQMPEGVRRFASIEEFLLHLEKSDG
jgi:hypothetical protein